MRWLSYYPALVRILEIYPSVITSLQDIAQEEDDCEARTLFDILIKFSKIADICIAADLLKPINMLMKIFQSREIDFETLETDYNICILKLKNFANGEIGK